MRVEGVWLRYHRRGAWALRDVSATVEAGQLVVLVGPNGAGKSSLLQIVTGTLRPTRGVVRDRPKVIGWAPERFPADQPFSVRTYLTYMARVRGLGRSAGAAVDMWTARLGLTRFLDVKVRDLSKGAAHKVGLAQALLVRPELLVLDEPWEGLDADARDLLPAIVAEARDAGAAVLVSDHRGEAAGIAGAAGWQINAGELATVELADLRAADIHMTLEGSLAGATLGDPDGAARPGGRRSGEQAYPERLVVEVAVAAAEANSVMGRLRASGYDVIGVRPASERAEEPA